MLADNGIGAPVSAEMEVIVYPIFPKIRLLAEKRSFSPDSEAQISCKITVYPPLEVKWTKKTVGQPQVDLVSRGRISIDSHRVSQTEIVSSLVISAVQESDSAVYTCSVAEERELLLLLRTKVWTTGAKHV